MDEKTQSLVAACLGLSPGELEVLFTISEYGGGGATYRDVADRLGTTPAYVSIVVGKLRRRGLVYRAGIEPRRSVGRRRIRYAVDREKLVEGLEECARRLLDLAKGLRGGGDAGEPVEEEKQDATQASEHERADGAGQGSG